MTTLLSWPTPGKLALTFALLSIALAPVHAQTDPSSNPKPVSAVMVNRPADIPDWEVGDIQVTYDNDETAVITHGEKCSHPRVSAKGLVGWSVWNDFNTTPAQHTGETLRILLPDGTKKNFKPNSRMIMDWNFEDDDSAVAIASMGYHGSTFFIKYDLASGRERGRVDQYVPYAQLPKWAQPLSEDKP